MDPPWKSLSVIVVDPLKDFFLDIFVLLSFAFLSPPPFFFIYLFSLMFFVPSFFLFFSALGGEEGVREGTRRWRRRVLGLLRAMEMARGAPKKLFLISREIIPCPRGRCGKNKRPKKIGPLKIQF